MKTNGMKKRILSFLIVLCMVCALLPMTVAMAATPITSVTVTGMDAPVVGQHPDLTAGITTVPANAAEIVRMRWIGDGGALDEDDVFEAGKEYYVWFEIAPKAGYTFTYNENEDFTGECDIAGLDVDMAQRRDSGSSNLYLDTPYIDALAPTGEVSYVYVYNVDAPIIGNHPDFTASIYTEPAYTAQIVSVNWRCDGEAMDADDVFEAGKEYYVWFEIAPREGYSFEYDENDDYTGECGIEGMEVDYADLDDPATGNLYLDTPYAPAFDPANFITSVKVTGLDVPVIGARPDFTASVTTVPANKAEILRIEWICDDAPMSEGDVFESGHYYYAAFEILPDEGCVFEYYHSEYVGTAAIAGYAVDYARVQDEETGSLYLDTTYFFAYDVSEYRSGSTYTYPDWSERGGVFAGWYTDPALTIPLGKNVTTGTAFAKFVDENVLSVKWQVSAGTSASSAKTSLRVLTTVDDLSYAQVGFTVEAEGKSPKNLVSRTVYQTIYGYTDGNNEAYTPNIFSVQSKYFMAHTLTGIPQSDFDKVIRVTPKWTTLDGTVVTGIPLEVRISDSF